MTKEKEESVLEKVKNMKSLNDVDKVKLNLQAMIQGDLVGFLRSQMAKVSAGSDLKNKVIEEIHNKLNDEEANIPLGSLITLLDIVGDQDNQIAIGILNILKESQKVVINNLPAQDGGKASEISADQMEQAKKLFNLFEMVGKMKESEYSLDELEKGRKE